jgi:hypothetical protein
VIISRWPLRNIEVHPLPYGGGPQEERRVPSLQQGHALDALLQDLELVALWSRAHQGRLERPLSARLADLPGETQSRAAWRFPRYRKSCLPAAIAAAPMAILRVTKDSSRRGDSWLNVIPLTANIPYDCR